MWPKSSMFPMRAIRHRYDNYALENSQT
uniref:Uncharacterized protein n=1 Tax=Rhizophora mucronata TaxID=61149 RepID=A0A2P2P447_RHIMU